MTLALAVVLNALAIFSGRIDRSFRPTGIDELNLLTLKQSWVTDTDDNGNIDTSWFIPRQRDDAVALRHVPGVTDVSVVNSLPLAGWSRNGRLSRAPSDKYPKLDAALYYADDSLLRTLGFHLKEGRNFSPAEVQDLKPNDPLPAGPILITQQLADGLFDGKSALGQVIFVNGSALPSTVVGVVQTLQTPSRSAWGDRFAFNSVIVPGRLGTGMTYFAIRVQPGALDRVKPAAIQALFQASPNRVIEDDGLKSFAEVRAEAYRADLSMAWMMIVISAVFILITASGVIGLTSFWVRKRQRSIGVRRALGATRSDILMQFLTENAVMAVTAASVGAIAAVSLNRLLMVHFEATRLHAVPTVIGMILLVLISLLSALVPSIKAATVAPVEAIRST
jgi:putative ABC transport system permease protein